MNYSSAHAVGEKDCNMAPSENIGKFAVKGGHDLVHGLMMRKRIMHIGILVWPE
jgi:hypothetical protein